MYSSGLNKTAGDCIYMLLIYIKQHPDHIHLKLLDILLFQIKTHSILKTTIAAPLMDSA